MKTKHILADVEITELQMMLKLKEMACVGQAGTGSVVRSVQCCQISFSSIKYCTIYNY
jgi:hypothetical protein